MRQVQLKQPVDTLQKGGKDEAAELFRRLVLYSAAAHKIKDSG
jgi:hypothetical protein